MSGIDMHFGGRTKVSPDTFSIAFAKSFDFQNATIAGKMSLLFFQISQLIQPIWGCIYDSQFSGKFVVNGKPTFIHWLNYWNKGTTEKIGYEKIENIAKKYSIIKWQDNIFQLGKTPLLPDSDEDRQLHAEISRSLGIGDTLMS
jgi:hypothetical protein